MIRYGDDCNSNGQRISGSLNWTDISYVCILDLSVGELLDTLTDASYLVSCCFSVAINKTITSEC